MDKLIQFLNGVPPSEQAAFANRCGTTVGYLRKAVSKRQKLGDGLCINIERESGGKVLCEELRPDIDWAYLRGSQRQDTSKEAVTSASPTHSAAPDRRDPAGGHEFADLDRRSAARG
jgi:DNA-binding transcriptional regulator YdaS (Cro superfamily)